MLLPVGAVAAYRSLSENESPAEAVKLPVVLRLGRGCPKPVKMLASWAVLTKLASEPVARVSSAPLALMERTPVTFAVICTAGLSMTLDSVPFAKRVPSWATTTRSCWLPDGPALKCRRLNSSAVKLSWPVTSLSPSRSWPSLGAAWSLRSATL